MYLCGVADGAPPHYSIGTHGTHVPPSPLSSSSLPHHDHHRQKPHYDTFPSLPPPPCQIRSMPLVLPPKLPPSLPPLHPLSGSFDFGLSSPPPPPLMWSIRCPSGLKASCRPPSPPSPPPLIRSIRCPSGLKASCRPPRMLPQWTQGCARTRATGGEGAQVWGGGVNVDLGLCKDSSDRWGGWGKVWGGGVNVDPRLGKDTSDGWGRRG